MRRYRNLRLGGRFRRSRRRYRGRRSTVRRYIAGRRM